MKTGVSMARWGETTGRHGVVLVCNATSLSTPPPPQTPARHSQIPHSWGVNTHRAGLTRGEVKQHADWRLGGIETINN